MRRARAGLNDENRPLGGFLFLGPTGVGKTELTKAVAEFLFDDDNAMVRTVAPCLTFPVGRSCLYKQKGGLMELKTKNLLLRPIRSADLEALFAIYSNATAMKYWSTLPLSEPAQMAEVLKGAIDGASEPTTQFSVLYQGRVIGRVGFWPIPEIGYILHPDFWQRGFATEVLGALIQHGFGNCGFDHLFADVDPDNAASIRLLEKAGFHEAGRAQNTIQIGGKWFDSVYFRLDAPA